MKNVVTTLLLLVTVMAYAQTKVELEVEKDGDSEQYKLKLEQEIDGKTVVTEKTYQSMEEMKTDPDLKEMDLHFMEGHGSSFKSKDGNILIEIDEDIEKGDHKMMFISKEGNEGEHVEMKVWVDEDGKKHVMKNGVEVDMGELHEQGDNKMVFISGGEEGETKIEVIINEEDGTKRIMKNGKEISLEDIEEGGENVFILKGEGEGEDVKLIEEAMEVEVTVDEDGTHHVKINGEEVDYDEWEETKDSNTMMWTEEREGGKHIKKEVIVIKKGGEEHKGRMVELIVNNIVLHLEDINAEDEEVFSLESSKELKLDEFNFYPNPSNGTFNLQFLGKDRPTTVKVTDIKGKEIYAEDLQDFGGSYDKEINLSGLKKGIYLLQVVQGSKAVNKKIVID